MLEREDLTEDMVDWSLFNARCILESKEEWTVDTDEGYEDAHVDTMDRNIEYFVIYDNNWSTIVDDTTLWSDAVESLLDYMYENYDDYIRGIHDNDEEEDEEGDQEYTPTESRKKITVKNLLID